MVFSSIVNSRMTLIHISKVTKRTEEPNKRNMADYFTNEKVLFLGLLILRKNASSKKQIILNILCDPTKSSILKK